MADDKEMMAALKTACENLTDENARMKQTIAALESRCVTLSEERDRFFDMKRTNAGEYMRERTQRQNYGALLNELVKRYPDAVADCMGEAITQEAMRTKLLLE